MNDANCMLSASKVVLEIGNSSHLIEYNIYSSEINHPRALVTGPRKARLPGKWYERHKLPKHTKLKDPSE